MQKIIVALLGGVALIVATLALFFPLGQPPRVAVGYASHLLCSETFVSGLDPERIFAERVLATPGMGLLRWGLKYEIDRSRREATASVFGLLRRRSVYREGYGCLLVQGEGDAGGAGAVARAAAEDSTANPDSRLTAAATPEPPAPRPVEASNPRISAALDRAFEEWTPARRRTKAIVVVHDGQIIAERYAPGYGVETRLLSWSAAKSVVSALIGVLVREGRLSVNQPAPVREWSRPGDPRGAITIDNLLRMNDGLDFSEGKGGIDKVSRMLFMARDMAGFVESAGLEAAPGTHWRYCSGATMVLSQIIRDAVGGSADDVKRFAGRELFGPLSMRSALFEFDATGVPIGSSFMFATARDWARFGMLYVNDGKASEGAASGQRILPEGWTRYSARPTPGSKWGYAAGFWTSLGDSEGATWRRSLGLPADSYLANGFQGQFVVVAPADRLVIVRFGITQGSRWGDVEGVARLTAEVIAALKERR